MVIINTNISSDIARTSLLNSTNELNLAIERMTTGFKINHSKDNAANFSIATSLTTKIGAYNVATENAAMALDMVLSAEGTLELISNRLQRLRDLQEQASNGTYGEASLKAINAEAKALVEEIERLYSTAEYNGQKFFVNELEVYSPLAMASLGSDSESKFINEVTVRSTEGMIDFASVNENQTLASGTYFLSTPEDLQKLAEMTNNFKLYNGSPLGTYEFVLANDIDLAGIEWTPIGTSIQDVGTAYFTGVFDGNGHSIKNLNMTNYKLDMSDYSNMYAGLFGIVKNADIKNIAVEDANMVDVGAYSAILVGAGGDIRITNCITSGFLSSGLAASGLAGECSNLVIDSSYSTATLSSTGSANLGAQMVAGLTTYPADISNSFFTGVLTGNCDPDNNIMMFPLAFNEAENSYFSSDSISAVNLAKMEAWAAGAGAGAGAVMGVSKNTEEIYTMFNVNPNASLDDSGGAANVSSLVKSFQIGINPDENSSIEVDFSIGLDDLGMLKNIGLDTNIDFLKKIDDISSVISSKMAMFGAVSNRLESALDETIIQCNNLISGRSTIKDSDIAEESSIYIQNQILQQASSTLLSTANQAPNIALQIL